MIDENSQLIGWITHRHVPHARLKRFAAREDGARSLAPSPVAPVLPTGLDDDQPCPGAITIKLLRAPAHLCDWHAGWILGRRFLRLTQSADDPGATTRRCWN